MFNFPPKKRNFPEEKLTTHQLREMNNWRDLQIESLYKLKKKQNKIRSYQNKIKLRRVAAWIYLISITQNKNNTHKQKTIMFFFSPPKWTLTMIIDEKRIIILNLTNENRCHKKQNAKRKRERKPFNSKMLNFILFGIQNWLATKKKNEKGKKYFRKSKNTWLEVRKKNLLHLFRHFYNRIVYFFYFRYYLPPLRTHWVFFLSPYHFSIGILII